MNENLKAELLITLLFYENFDNYIFNKDGRGLTIPHEDDKSVIVEDCGERARQLIEKLGFI
jgi:hypothetical protein